jgi:signal peptidase
MGKAWKVIKGIFWIAITFAAMFMLFTSLNLFGFQMFVVKSGSMEPNINISSVVFDHREANYYVGDVITYRLANSKETVTHRIVEVTDNSNTTVYKVKGDANETPDFSPVFKEDVVGKVLFSVPYLGRLIMFIRTLPGLTIFIIIPAMIIIADEMSNIKNEAARIKKAKDKAVVEPEKLKEENLEKLKKQGR